MTFSQQEAAQIGTNQIWVRQTSRCTPLVTEHRTRHTEWEREHPCTKDNTKHKGHRPQQACAVQQYNHSSSRTRPEEGSPGQARPGPGTAMEWSHTHFDGYELLALPSDSPASIVILDSSALVLVQRVLLPEGDAPPRALTWQPGGASTGCSSGALSCIVSTKGRRLVWYGVM